jgi:signal transduction histidine kinase
MQINTVQTLQSFGRFLVTTPLSTAAILEQMLARIEPVAGAAPVRVWLYDPASERYALRQTTYPTELQDQDPAFDSDSGLARWLRESEQPVYRADGQGFDAAKLTVKEREAIDTLDVAAFVPLGARSEYGTRDRQLGGWIALGPRPSGEPYSLDDLDFVAALADQAALALDAVRLTQDIQKAKQAELEFIDYVAHELKQPMTAMQGYAKMLMMGLGGELNDTQRQFVQVINANIDRMDKLINDLLEISRLEAGRIKLKLAPVPIEEVVDETLSSSRGEIEARHHTLVVEVAEGLPPALADRKRLVQILTNLVSNAARYTPNGGTLRIAASRHDRPGIPPAQLLVTVSDTGIGMSPQDIAKLEGKFFRADHDLVYTQPGTGLGVPIARHLVELHGGELWVESEVNRGSTVSFTLPIADGHDE